jgi:hypothetical protein
VERPKDGLYVNLGGHLVDLQSGMLDAVRNPPAGFVSDRTFVQTDISARLKAIPWFTRCGEPPVPLDVTPPTSWVPDWQAASVAHAQPEWEDATLEAQNQLTLWLHVNAPEAYLGWNEHVRRFKAEELAGLEPAWRAYQLERGLDDGFLHSLQWNVLGALMANHYLPLGHTAFFFLELLRVYEAGRFPCGWEGAWPRGRLVIH